MHWSSLLKSADSTRLIHVVFHSRSVSPTWSWDWDPPLGTHLSRRSMRYAERPTLNQSQKISSSMRVSLRWFNRVKHVLQATMLEVAPPNKILASKQGLDLLCVEVMLYLKSVVQFSLMWASKTMQIDRPSFYLTLNRSIKFSLRLQQIWSNCSAKIS